MLLGREMERGAVDRLVADVARGRGRGVGMCGEAGRGGDREAALLDYAVSAAARLRVLHAVGVESEAELAFGALHQLLFPHLDRLDMPPGPQAAAPRAPFGLVDGREAN
ncbi:hypothetical protein [Streptomyces sp. NPDC020747]|uniref:hypothetical protein n=1 Tax=Streptomyces sp. NPDC020747 TaxID=3365086 RepID=UPI00379CEA70